MPFVEIGGHWLEALWHGPPPEVAPTLVFLHEGLGSARGWRDFPARLSEATGCGALVYSRRGYGRSDRIGRKFSASFMHDEALVTLPAMLERFRIGSPILVGHSDGASIALIHAGSGGSARALILVAPHVFVEAATVASIVAIRDRFADPELRTRFALQHGPNTDALLSSWTEVWLSPEFSAWNIESSARGVTCPVLVIQGEDDEYGTIGQVESIRAHVRGTTRVVMLPGCGHAPHRERSDETLAQMSTFVAGLGPGAIGATSTPAAEPPQLRPLLPGDLPALWQIFRDAILEGATYVQDDVTSEADFSEYWCGRGGEQWVAMLDDAIVGGFTLRPNQVGRGAHVATASYVVAARIRGRGLGRALCEHSIARASELGFSGIQFNLVVSTNVEAIALWRRCGFRVIGTLPEAFEHRALGKVDAYVMFRALP